MMALSQMSRRKRQTSRASRRRSRRRSPHKTSGKSARRGARFRATPSSTADDPVVAMEKMGVKLLESKALKATTCKIRGFYTNQPQKVGEPQYGLIDHVMSSMEGRIQTQFECPHQGDRITDYSRLLPQYGDDAPNYLDPKNTQSTSDHMPVIVDFQPNGIGLRLMQMNLLANLLMGDGFLKGSASLPQDLPETLEEFKKEINKIKTTADELKKWGKTDEWRTFREKKLKEDGVRDIVQQNSITVDSLSDAAFYKRTRLLMQSIIKANPDVITFQENDMDLMLQRASLLHDKYVHVVTTLKGKDGTTNGTKAYDAAPEKVKQAISKDLYLKPDGVSLYMKKNVFEVVSTCTFKLPHDAPCAVATLKRLEDNFKFEIMTTHLSAGDGGQDRMERTEQLQELYKQITTIKKYSQNIILAMDANENLLERRQSVDRGTGHARQ